MRPERSNSLRKPHRLVSNTWVPMARSARKIKKERINHATGLTTPLCRDATARTVRMQLDRSRDFNNIIYGAKTCYDRFREFFLPGIENRRFLYATHTVSNTSR